MKFRNCVIDRNVDFAVKQVEKLLTADSHMIKELSAKTDWKYGAENVVAKLLENKEPINVYTYRSKNPFSKAVGYFDGKAIHISTKALQTFNFEQLCGLLLHEYSHYCGYNHGTGMTANYKNDDKVKYSVPYFLSENITRWV